MELSQNYVKLLSLSSLSKNTWQNENLQSRYFNSSSLHTTLPSLLAVPKCPVVFTVYCCSPVFLPPAQWRPSSPAAWRDDSSLSMSDTGSSGVPATKVTSKHTLSRRIIWCNCKKNHQDIQSGLFFIEHYLFLQLERLPSHRHLLESHTALAYCSPLVRILIISATANDFCKRTPDTDTIWRLLLFCNFSPPGRRCSRGRAAALHMSQMLYAGKSARPSVLKLSDF